MDCLLRGLNKWLRYLKKFWWKILRHSHFTVIHTTNNGAANVRVEQINARNVLLSSNLLIVIWMLEEKARNIQMLKFLDLSLGRIDRQGCAPQSVLQIRLIRKIFEVLPYENYTVWIKKKLGYPFLPDPRQFCRIRINYCRIRIIFCRTRINFCQIRITASGSVSQITKCNL